MGNSDPFSSDEDAQGSEAATDTISRLDLPDGLSDTIENTSEFAQQALSEIIGVNAIVFGLAIGMIIGATGEAQTLVGVLAAILAGERVKLRLSEKVKVKILKEPSLAILGSVLGYLLSVYLI